MLAGHMGFGADSICGNLNHLLAKGGYEEGNLDQPALDQIGRQRPAVEFEQPMDMALGNALSFCKEGGAEPGIEQIGYLRNSAVFSEALRSAPHLRIKPGFVGIAACEITTDKPFDINARIYFG